MIENIVAIENNKINKNKHIKQLNRFNIFTGPNFIAKTVVLNMLFQSACCTIPSKIVLENNKDSYEYDAFIQPDPAYYNVFFVFNKDCNEYNISTYEEKMCLYQSKPNESVLIAHDIQKALLQLKNIALDTLNLSVDKPNIYLYYNTRNRYFQLVDGYIPSKYVVYMDCFDFLLFNQGVVINSKAKSMLNKLDFQHVYNNLTLTTIISYIEKIFSWNTKEEILATLTNNNRIDIKDWVFNTFLITLAIAMKADQDTKGLIIIKQPEIMLDGNMLVQFLKAIIKILSINSNVQLILCTQAYTKNQICDLINSSFADDVLNLYSQFTLVTFEASKDCIFDVKCTVGLEEN